MTDGAILYFLIYNVLLFLAEFIIKRKYAGREHTAGAVATLMLALVLSIGALCICLAITI